jgi:hypothetical protein
MAHEMTVKLTEQEYARLKAAARQVGKSPEILLHELIQQLPFPKSYLSSRAFEEILYEEGLIEDIPTRQPETPQEQAERERLGQVFANAGGKPMSEMVIEDRGPY